MDSLLNLSVANGSLAGSAVEQMLTRKQGFLCVRTQIKVISFYPVDSQETLGMLRCSIPWD